MSSGRNHPTHRPRRGWRLASWAFAVAVVAAAPAWASVTERISESPDGAEPDATSREPSITRDLRYVAYESKAQNIVQPDANGSMYDVFVYDRTTLETVRVSQIPGGAQGNADSQFAVISADGVCVAFMSKATNFTADDYPDWDYFVYYLDGSGLVRVSETAAGEPANGGADCECKVYKFPGVSADCRFVAFTSNATNLVPGGTNGEFQVFVKDLETGEVVLASVSSDGEQGNDQSYVRDMSLDGRYVVFQSTADNLVDGDTNGVQDIFLHDLETGETWLVSRHSSGELSNGRSDSPRVSEYGRHVTYASLATNLVDGEDTNGEWDVFLYDVATGTTELISQSSAGARGNNFSRHPSISAEGRFVTFHSMATTHVPEDGNGCRDVFLRDRQNGKTFLLSAGSAGEQGDMPSFDGFLSPYADAIVFDSWATNFDPDDSNDLRDIFIVEP